MKKHLFYFLFISIFTLRLFSQTTGNGSSPCAAIALYPQTGCGNTSGPQYAGYYQSENAGGANVTMAGTTTLDPTCTPDNETTQSVEWLLVTATASTFTITNQTDYGNSPGLAAQEPRDYVVYSGNCSSLTQLQCITNLAGGSSATVTGLVAGQTYYIMVSQSSSAYTTCSNCTGVSTCITSTTPFIPSNDNCGTPFNLTTNVQYTSTNANSTADGPSVCQNPPSGSVEDNVWYQWCAPSNWPAGQTAYLIVNNQVCNSTQGLQLSIYSPGVTCTNIIAGTATSLVCQNPGSTTNYNYAFTANPSQCYLITLDGFAGVSCTYTIMVSGSLCALPVLNVTAATPTICSGSSTSLSASCTSNCAGISYSWSPATGLSSTTGASVTASPTVTTTYTVTGSLSATCLISQTVTVNVVAAPTMTSANTASICTGNAINLNLTSSVPSNYSWLTSNNANTTGESITAQSGSTITNTITSTSTSPTTLIYTVTPTSNPGNCPGTPQNVTVTVNPLPTVSVAANPTITCTNTLVAVSGSSTTAGVNYSWSPGGSSPIAASTNVSSVGSYVLTVTNPTTNCSNTGTVTVATNTLLPNISTAANPTITCTNTLVAVSGSSTTAGVNYSWSPGGSTPTAASTNVSSAGNYVLIVTNPANGCISSGTVTVGTNTVTPNISTATNPTITCTNTLVSVSGSSTTAGVNYSWSPGGSAPTANSTNVSSAGNYVLTVTNPANGCISTGTVTVGTNTVAPNISTASNPTITCTNTLVAVSGSSTTIGVNYSWSPGGSTPTTASTNVSSVGNYVLTVTNPANGCLSSGTVTVGTNTIAPNISTAINPTITCTNTLVAVSGSSTTSGVNYFWSPGGSSPTAASTNVSSAGNYVLTVTNPANGCTSTGTVTVGTNTVVPNISTASNPTITCTNTLVAVSGSSTTAGINYSWSPGGSTPTANSTNVSSAGNYVLTVTNPANGCISSGTVTVGTNTVAPNISTATNPTITCTNTLVAVSGSSTTAGVNYSWSPGGSSPTADSTNVSTAGDYVLTVTNPANGCTSTGTVTVNSNVNQPIVTLGTDPVITCTNQIVSLNASSSITGSIFSWSPGGSTPNLSTTNVSSTGQYTVTITNPNNGCVSTATANVTQNTTQPAISVNSATPISCISTTSTLSGSSTTSGVNYLWSPAGTTPSSSSTVVNAAGTYTLTVTNPTNGCTNSGTVQVTTTGVPNVSVNPASELTCTTTSVTISGASSTSGVTYTWSGPLGAVSSTNNGSTTSATVNIPGEYTLTVSDGTCTNSGIVVVGIDNTLPNISIGPDAEITCTNTSVQLNGSSTSSGITINWSGPPGFTPSTTNTINTIIPGTYTLTITDPSNACTATLTAEVTSNTLIPDVDAGQNQVITCLNASVVLTGTSSVTSANYLWNAGTNPTSNSTSVNNAGNYTLTVTDPANGCTNSDVVAVTTNTLAPLAIAGNPQTLTCAATTVTLTGSSNVATANYLWSPGGTTPNNATTQVNTTGNYELTVTDPSNGCSSSATVVVNSNTTLPDVNSGNDQIITCANASVTLTGNSNVANANFLWSNGVSNPNNSTTTVSSVGDFTLTVTDPANGCTNTDIVSVSSNTDAPNANAGNDQTLTCAVTSVTLTGSSTNTNITYLWSPAGANPTSATNNVSTTGLYTLTVTDNGNGCSSSDVVEVLPDANLPQLTMGSNQQLTCLVTSVNILGTSVTNNVNFTWDASVSNSNGSSATVSNPGDYTLTVTNITNGCSNSGVVTVSIDTISPNVDAGLNQTLTCSVTSVTLTGNSTTPGATYLWSPAGDTPTASSTNVAIIGIYTLTVTNPINGCSSNDIVQVLPDANLPSITMGQNQTLNCNISSVSISGQTNTSNASYTWNPPGTTPSSPSTEVTISGIYTLTVTDLSNGCSSSSTISVTSDLTIPAATIDPVQPITCSTSSSIISASSDVANAGYSWSGPNNFNSTQANNNITAAGLYTLIVTHPVSTCTATVSINVLIDTISPSISATSSASTLTCAQEFTDLIGSSSTPGVNYQWSGVSGAVSGNPAIINSPGNYTLTVTNPLNGCVSNATVLINQNITIPQAQSNISTPILNCEITDAFLNANGSSTFNYIWAGPNSFTSVEQNPAQSINTIGTYTLYVIDPTNGCSDSSFVSLAQGPNPVADFTFDPSLGYMPLSVNFTNQSSIGFTNGYSWSFGDGNTSVEINPNNIYTSSGTFTITLIGYGNVAACNDTVEKTILVYPEIKLEIPNVFSPNGDGNNDDYFIISSGFKELNVTIFNRWGSVIATFNAIGGSWDGTNGNGVLSAEGTYYYILNGSKMDDVKFEAKGFITLTR